MRGLCEFLLDLARGVEDSRITDPRQFVAVFAFENLKLTSRLSR